MGRVKIVNEEELHKEYDRILEGVSKKVKGMIGLILTGAQEKLQTELQGIPLDIMNAVMEMEIASVASVKGKHDVDREYYRGGSNPGSVVIDEQRIPVSVPRAVRRENKVSYTLKSYAMFHKVGSIAKRAYQDLIRGVSTRRFDMGIKKFLGGYGFSASAVSRHMVEGTSQKLKELMKRRLENLELVVLMLDGVQIARDAVVVVALGIDKEGVKHILGLRQGSTENSRVVKGLLEDLLERGMDIERPLLVVIDGAKALRSAVKSVLGSEMPVQRCVVHKMRNVGEELSKKDRPWVHQAMLRAYHAPDIFTAESLLKDLQEKLRVICPAAANSLREGMEETLTVHRLGLPPLLRQSLRSTNSIESANQGVRNRTRNVKWWQEAEQIERWVAAGLLETEKGFRSIKGHKQISLLIAALENLNTDQRQAA